ncbi:MAG: putative diguanylate cyclase [Clostridiales bacterium]|jgi:diguanylate cyclase (GGDEF)-like protein|nr:putative diguanylate cyclase [Clostridiales bacterium]
MVCYNIVKIKLSIRKSKFKKISRNESFEGLIRNKWGDILRFDDPVYLIIIFLAALFTLYEYRLLQKHKKLLKRYEKIRKTLYDTSEKISKINDEDEIYSIVLDAIVELIPNATRGSVLLFGEDGNFHFQVVKGFQKELENLVIKKEEAYLYKINGFSKTAIINNPREFDRVNTGKDTVEELHKINALDICCTISAPIYIDNNFIGLINVDSDKAEHIFTENDLELMNQIKCELELSVKNALAQNKLKYLANFDELTGVMNRRTLKEEFDSELEKIKYEKQPFCFVMIDMDNFKFFNDTFGHYFGDKALKKFSNVLYNSVNKTDVVARFAGDEFIILFRNCDLALAETKMKSITEAVTFEKLDGIILEFSYGICEVRSYDNMNFDKTLAHADSQMYEHKKSKKC